MRRDLYGRSSRVRRNNLCDRPVIDFALNSVPNAYNWPSAGSTVSYPLAWRCGPAPGTFAGSTIPRGSRGHRQIGGWRLDDRAELVPAARGNLHVVTAWKDGAPQQPGLDTSRPNIARVYDYWLGGKDNFETDREEAERLLQIYPDLRRLARENRLFLGRAVHWLAADCGIRQFLDIGSGLPTVSNTHDVAQAAAPDSKVAYVDKDPRVVLHAEALLADGHDVIAVRGDAADPAAILADPRVNTLIQPGRPYAVILAAVLHFFPLADARRIITELAGLAAPGSYLIISVGSSGSRLAREYTAGTLHDYSPDEIRTLLTGLEIIDPPGLVDALHWAPGTPAPAPAPPGGRILAAVARMPG
jgi:hypothetical protein